VIAPSPTFHGRADDKRQARRTKVFLLAQVAGDGTETLRRVHVLDISAQGARLHARSVSDPGGKVELVVGGKRQPASIVWVDHPTFGIRFATPLTDERLHGIVAAG